MIKNRILQIFLFLIFLAISLIIFKKFNKYYSQNDFAKIIILVLLAINFFFGFAIKKFSKLSLIFLSYFLLIIYSVNSLLVYFDVQNTPKKQIEKILNKRGETFDKRTILEVVKEERLLGKDIYPYVVPREFLKLNKEKIPLTPIPNTLFVSCNEYGTWKNIKTDKYGFNNKKFLDSFDVLLMGDSFAEGSCVKQEYEPANLFEKNHQLKTYNIGISGNGPLISLALAHEIKLITEFDYIVWFIFDNDFYDLGLEKNSNYLINYLNTDFESNNYFSKIQNETDYQKKYIEDNLESFKSGFSLKESILELKPLINRINKLINQKALEDAIKYDKNIFKKIFDKARYLYPEKKIFVVYLPETTCFMNRSEECNQRFNEISSFSENIIYLNFFQYLKDNIKNYEEMYALGLNRAHFSPAGYNTLIEFIYKNIQK